MISGDINNVLIQLEKGAEHPPIATHVLVLMVRQTGVPIYAHFGSEGVSADTLFLLYGRQSVAWKLMVLK